MDENFGFDLGDIMYSISQDTVADLTLIEIEEVLQKGGKSCSQQRV